MFLLFLVPLLLLPSNTSSAQGGRTITLLEGQAAIEKYAELTGMSVAEVEAMIARERAARETSERDIQPMGAGGFKVPFDPDCTYNGQAWGLFDVGAAYWNVQFTGSDIWSTSGFCGGTECTYLAHANLNQPGDTVWLLYVYSIWANDLGHWCSWFS